MFLSRARNKITIKFYQIILIERGDIQECKES